MKREPEHALYPMVERWLKRHFLCFATGINKGLQHSRIDVVGVRDIGGDLSGAVETIAIEVKRGNYPFANASGQTLGYNVYANRVYLADVRPSSFAPDEIQIASHLGIGLIQIHGHRCVEVLSSPFYYPIEKLNLRLLETLRLGLCQFCGCYFEIGTPDSSRWSKLSSRNLRAASEKEQGLVFWNYEVGERKRKLRRRLPKGNYIYERRFICPDCVSFLVKQWAPEK